jgi:hypothetical protein
LGPSVIFEENYLTLKGASLSQKFKTGLKECLTCTSSSVCDEESKFYNVDCRTPHYGGMTPSHTNEDGSRTPGRSSAWDPTVSNTPAASRDYDDYNFDDTTPSPNYNPATPGGGESGRYESPSGAPYTPATPGSVYNPQEGYSPYHPSPTGASPSPNSYVLTPSPGQGYQATPSPNYAAPSPGLGYSPMTPGSHSPYTPQTPGHTVGDSLGSSVKDDLLASFKSFASIQVQNKLTKVTRHRNRRDPVHQIMSVSNS